MGLMVDEWGVWDRMIPEEEKKYGRALDAEHHAQRRGGAAWG